MWEWLVGLWWVLYGPVKDDDYEPRFSGQWVKQRGSQDKWKWREFSSPGRPLYVNVYSIADEYVIRVSHRPGSKALDTVECRDQREAELFVDMFYAYYSTLGTTITDKAPNE